MNKTQGRKFGLLIQRHFLAHGSEHPIQKQPIHHSEQQRHRHRITHPIDKRNSLCSVGSLFHPQHCNGVLRGCDGRRHASCVTCACDAQQHGFGVGILLVEFLDDRFGDGHAHYRGCHVGDPHGKKIRETHQRCQVPDGLGACQSQDQQCQSLVQMIFVQRCCESQSSQKQQNHRIEKSHRYLRCCSVSGKRQNGQTDHEKRYSEGSNIRWQRSHRPVHCNKQSQRKTSTCTLRFLQYR